MQSATRVACTQAVQAPEGVQFERQDAKDRFAAVIVQFPAKAVARATGISIDAINSWRIGRRFPDWDSLRKLEPHFPSVRQFIAREFGFQVEAPPSRNDAVAALVAALDQAGNDSTPEAALARSLRMRLT